MNKISSRDIRLLVAGALALDGFRALIWIPYCFIDPMESLHIVSRVVTAVALPIGIGIFFGRPWATLLAQIYLWLVLIVGCIAIPLYWHFVREGVIRLVSLNVPEILIASVLLVLIFWSSSERFKREPDA